MGLFEHKQRLNFCGDDCDDADDNLRVDSMSRLLE